MNVLDLFSGLGGWSAAFRERGHSVVTLDLEPRFGADHVRDILSVASLGELERGGRFDVVLASPPCECFSVMTIGRNWTRDHKPKTPQAELALRIAWHTFYLVDAYAPTWYVIENPRGKLRRVAPRPPNATTFYCRWGMRYAKPTDLWTNLNGGMPTGWPLCYPRAQDHDYQPRVYGARKAAGVLSFGTQGVGAPSTGGNRALLGKPIADAKRRPDGRYDTRSIRDAITRGERVVGWHIRSNGRLDRRTAWELTTSGSRKARRALIPPALSLAVAFACETDGVVRQSPAPAL